MKYDSKRNNLGETITYTCVNIDRPLYRAHTRQVYKEIEEYCRKNNLPDFTGWVDQNDYGSFIFEHCEDEDDDDYEQSLADFKSVVKDLFEDGGLLDLPTIEALYSLNGLEENLEASDGLEIVIEQICWYPDLILRCLYSYDGAEIEKEMVELFERVMERSPTDDERSHFTVAAMEPIMQQD